MIGYYILKLVIIMEYELNAGLQIAARDLNIYTLGSKETQTSKFQGSYTLC